MPNGKPVLSTQSGGTLAEFRAAIAALPEDDRIRIEAIAMTLRHAVKLGRGHARCAFALVGAELEALDDRPHR